MSRLSRLNLPGRYRAAVLPLREDAELIKQAATLQAMVQAVHVCGIFWFTHLIPQKVCQTMLTVLHPRKAVPRLRGASGEPSYPIYWCSLVNHVPTAVSCILAWKSCSRQSRAHLKAGCEIM